MHFKNLWNNFAERIKYLAVWELNHHVRIIADSLDFNSMFKNIYFSTNKKWRSYCIKDIENISSLFRQFRLLDGEFQRSHEGAHDAGI